MDMKYLNSPEMMDMKHLTSPKMSDGMSAFFEHHVRYRDTVWRYVGVRRGSPPAMMVLQNARGETVEAVCFDCEDAAPCF